MTMMHSPRSPWTRFAVHAGVLVLAMGLAGGAARAQESGSSAPPPSEAERLVFTTPHLAGLKPPTELRYRFHREGSLAGASLDDEARLTLRATAAGACCEAETQFLSGPMQIKLPPVENALGNPVTLHFLERQVKLMNELTKGTQNHFRKRIRLALVDEAEVRTGEREFAGRRVPVREVRVRPFLNDPNRYRYEKHAQREYLIVLAEDVPGTVLELRCLEPGAKPGDAPALLETLTLLAPAGPTP